MILKISKIINQPCTEDSGAGLIFYERNRQI